jgi:nucleotide-binding universal stress UspA family protein
MFRKIIWATDGSDSADGALPLVTSLAAESGAELVVVHSVEHLAGPRSTGAPTLQADEDEVEQKVARRVAELSEQGIEASSSIVQGGVTGAAHTLAKVAGELGADLIVAGTRGHNPVVGLLLRSVTQRLVAIAPCPVLVVPRRAG